MGNCLSTDDKPPKYPPSQQDLNRSTSQAPVSPNGVQVSIDHTRPLPSTPKAKGENQSNWITVFDVPLYTL